MSKSNLPKVNRGILAKEVRLVGPDGEMFGVVSITEALQKAESMSLDLIEISPHAAPPVCKILDFGKFKYENKKRVHDSRKKQKVTVTKEMKFKLNIGQGDFDVKLRKIKEFLAEGDKVKVSMMFKGREIAHNQFGMKVFHKIIEMLGDLAKIDLEPRMEGKQIMMMLSPAVVQKKV